MRISFLIGYALAFFFPALCDEVSITIQDNAAAHVHVPGASFSIGVTVSYTAASTITCRWYDFKGNPLSADIQLTNRQQQTILSPGSATGYCELVFKAGNSNVNFPSRQPGEARQFGFAVQPSVPFTSRIVDPGSAIGLVHADINDVYCNPGWVKTLWSPQSWDTAARTVDQAGWHSMMADSRTKAQTELPIFAGSGWNTDGGAPLTSTALAQVKSMMKQFFAADTATHFWELGIEENLGAEFGKPYYWTNVKAKFQAGHQAASELGQNVKLIYQVAGLDYAAPESLFNTGAGNEVDILSMHPYAWPDFKSPETWMPDFISRLRAIMQKYNRNIPIWFTEAGAPYQGNAPGAFFGYGTSDTVKGASRTGGAVYLIKLYTLALALGVEKIFWYNYKDAGDSRTNPEDHFGMIDYWGYPKPGYPAFITVIGNLRGKTFVNSKQSGDVYAYEFRNSAENCIVAWRYPASAPGKIPLSSLRANVTGTQVIRVTDAVGTAAALNGDSVSIGAEPVFIVCNPASAVAQQTVPPKPAVDFGRPYMSKNKIFFPFRTAGSGIASLSIYDVKGHRVATLAGRYVRPGENKLEWGCPDKKGNGTADGIYIAKIILNEESCAIPFVKSR